MYLDLLFLINLLINYFILLVTARLFRKQPAAPRLIVGAAVGAMTVLLFKLPPYPVLTLAATLATPAIMVALVFRPLRRLELLMIWCSLFAVSFMIGGAVLALSLLRRPEISMEPPRGVASLLWACLLVYVVLTFVRPYLEERKWQKLLELTLLVSWQGKQKMLPAYLDTGNRLREPLTMRPVIVVYYRSLEELLPPEVFRRLADPKLETWAVFPDLDEIADACSFSLIPFKDLGGKGGMLLGFKPDAVTVSQGKRSWSVESNVVLGITRRGFGPVAEYQALLPPDLLEAG